MKKSLITHLDPKSPVSEIFRSLRTNMQFMNMKGSLKTILITSTRQGEGKSYVASNLAVAFAKADKKVILIDADMRKPTEHTIFGISPRPGLSNYLSGISDKGEDSDNKIVNYIQETAVDNLFVIPAGNIPPNPSELLISEKMEELIESLKAVCDIVIFDGTPSVLVTDSIILSRKVDSTIIVGSYKSTKMDELVRIKKDIENVGGKVAGFVLNKVQISSKKYEEKYYYGSTTAKLESRRGRTIGSTGEARRAK